MVRFSNRTARDLYRHLVQICEIATVTVPTQGGQRKRKPKKLHHSLAFW